MAALVTDATKHALPDLSEVGVAVFDATLTPTVDAGAVGSLTGEITTGDAPGYTRVASVTVAWDPSDRRLYIDDDWPTFDLEGAPSVAYVVVYDPNDSDQVVSFIPFTDQPGFDGWEAVLGGGVAGWDDEWPLRALIANHADRIEALEATPPGGGGVPDPSGEDDGDVLTVASGAAVWAPPTGGGGGAIDAHVVDLTSETPGVINVDLSTVPNDRATVLVYLPAGDNELVITDAPDSTARGPMGVIVEQDSGSLVVVGDVTDHISFSSVPNTPTRLVFSLMPAGSGGWRVASDPMLGLVMVALAPFIAIMDTTEAAPGDVLTVVTPGGPPVWAAP